VAVKLGYSNIYRYPLGFPEWQEDGLPVESLPAGRTGTSQPAEKAGPTHGWAVVWTLLGVFAGGMALNLTPCVYPLIPITVSYFGGRSTERKGKLVARCIFCPTPFIRDREYLHPGSGGSGCRTSSRVAQQNDDPCALIRMVQGIFWNCRSCNSNNPHRFLDDKRPGSHMAALFRSVAARVREIRETSHHGLHRKLVYALSQAREHHIPRSQNSPEVFGQDGRAYTSPLYSLNKTNPLTSQSGKGKLPT